MPKNSFHLITLVKNEIKMFENAFSQLFKAMLLKTRHNKNLKNGQNECRN